MNTLLERSSLVGSRGGRQAYALGALGRHLLFEIRMSKTTRLYELTIVTLESLLFGDRSFCIRTQDLPFFLEGSP